MLEDIRRGKGDYAVKSIETVAHGKDVIARVFTLAPGDVTPWHSHSKVTDHYFVLSGRLSVETRNPDAARTLAVGERFAIPAGNVHQISNHGTDDCRFLLVQGVGQYDWVKADG